MTEKQQESLKITQTEDKEAEVVDSEISDQSSENTDESNDIVKEDENIQQEPMAEPVFAEPEEPIETTIESVIEAILFASDESLSATKLAAIVEITSIHNHLSDGFLRFIFDYPLY